MEKTEPIGPFLGMNNRLPEDALSRSERGRKVGDYLRNAVNVDLTQTGSLRRRRGATKAVECTDAHSLWGEDPAYYIDGTTLYRYPRQSIRADLVPGLRASFDRGPRGEVFWSNGAVLEQIVGDASVALTPATPNPVPTAVAVAGGSLPGGLYLIAFAAQNAAGEQSPPTPAVQLVVPDGGRIQVSGMSGTVAIYLSPQNGDLLFRAATTTAATHEFAVTPDLGAQLSTLNLRAMPAGHIVRWFNGRLLVAAGHNLFISEPYAPGLYNPLRGFVPFMDRLSLVRPCENGVFVAAGEETYWLAGNNPVDAELAKRLPYGAVEGSDATSPKDQSVWWFSTRGQVIGLPDGSVRNVQEDDLAVGPAGFGASVFRETNGVQQRITALANAEISHAAADSFFEAEIIRKGEMQ